MNVSTSTVNQAAAVQHVRAADRFARDRWFFEDILCGALAAADAQAVEPRHHPPPPQVR